MAFIYLMHNKPREMAQMSKVVFIVLLALVLALGISIVRAPLQPPALADALTLNYADGTCGGMPVDQQGCLPV